MEAGVDSGAPREPSHHDRRLAAGLAVAGFGTRVVAVPELAVGVEAPGHAAAVRAQRDALAVDQGGRDRYHPRHPGDGYRFLRARVAVAGIGAGAVAVAELAGGVAAPCHDSAV